MCDIDLDGIITYLSQKLNRIFYDREFVSYVNEDLQLLLNKQNKCALVFPVLEPIFLKAVYFQAKFYDLGVFYVGFGRKKSIIVCHKEHLQEKSDDVLSVQSICGNSTVSMSKEDAHKNNNKGGKKSRPALQLYVPPAQRAKKTSLDNIKQNKPLDKIKSKKYNTLNEIIPKTNSPLEQSITVITNKKTYLQDVINSNERIENLDKLVEKNDNSRNAQNESLNNVQYIMHLLMNKIEEECNVNGDNTIVTSSISEENNTNNHIINGKFDDKTDLVIQPSIPQKNDEMDKEKEEMRRAKNKINRKSRPIMKYIDIDNDTLHIDKENPDFGENLTNWEDMFNDEGELKDKFAFEITKHMGNDTKVFKVSKDYSAYQGKIEDLEHVVEIYDFPATFQTHDIMQLFYEVNNETMYVKWVDDTHALLVLSSPAKAQRALQVQSDLIKSRPLCDASSISLETAYKSDLKPAMKRPQTNLLTARRMINSHLGTKSSLSREAIEHEKKLLRQAREQRRLEKQNERDAWEGNPRPSTA